MVSPLADRDHERLLQAFADAWNRHDVDALMLMMTSTCVFEASGALRSTATDTKAKVRYGPRTPPYSNSFRMRTGATRDTSSPANGASRNGHSREQHLTASESKSPGATC